MSNNASKKEPYIHDKALINWALQNKDQDNILSVYILSNAILNISHIDELNEGYMEKIDISSIYNKDDIIGIILIDFLSAFRYGLIRLGKEKIEENKDIFNLPIKDKGVLRIFLEDEDCMKPYWFYLKNDSVKLLYTDLIKTYLMLMKTYYKRDFTKYLKAEFFDEDYDDDRLMFKLDLSIRIMNITQNLSEILIPVTVKRLGVPDFEEHGKRIFKYTHPFLYRIKILLIGLAPTYIPILFILISLYLYGG